MYNLKWQAGINKVVQGVGRLRPTAIMFTKVYIQALILRYSCAQWGHGRRKVKHIIEVTSSD